MLYIHPQTMEVTRSKKHVMFSRLWSTVRPGWRVHHLRTNDLDLRTSGAGQTGWVNVDLAGFMSPDRSETVIAAVNPTHQPKPMTFVGFNASKLKVYSTDVSRDDQLILESPIDKGTVKLELPPMSVSILHATTP
jgi:hypothetical protein